jgi:hypothetical protein
VGQPDPVRRRPARHPSTPRARLGPAPPRRALVDPVSCPARSLTLAGADDYV